MTDYYTTKNRMEAGGDAWKIGDGGALDVEDGGELTIEDGGTLTLASGSILNIENGGALDVSSGSDLDVEDGASLDVESGGEINVDSGGTINLSGAFDIKDGGAQTVESGGSVTFESGSTITLEAGSTVTGLTGQTTFASDVEAKAGTVTDKVIAPDTLKAAINDKLAAMPWNAVIVVGTETENVINVAIQLKDVAAADMAVRGSVLVYLSDDANGDSIAEAAPSGGVAIGTDGLAIPVVAGKCVQLISESDGDIDLDIEESGEDTWYLIVVLPNGKLVASDAIAFVTEG